MNAPREQALMLGARGSMLGILTPASAATADEQRPVIIILNAGIMHRVGPSRLHVLLARRLASLGFTVLRFDLSGVGDSEPRLDTLPPMEAALADLREVLDGVASRLPGRRVVCVGLCSGADQSMLYAGRDPRVTGVVLVDPHIPRTRRYYLHYYGRRLFRVSSWLNVLLGRHPVWRRQRTEAVATATLDRPDQDFIRQLSSPEVRAFLGGAYRHVLQAQIRLLAVFTGGLEAQHCYREQLIDAFPALDFSQQLRLEYLKDADHMFESEAQRSQLIELIADWLSQTWPRQSAA